MNIRKFDNKYVQIEDIFGSVYEGICDYNGREYNYHEYGKDEESLSILNFMFFKSIIKNVKLLEENEGPYGHFTSRYGELEEEIINSGSYFIEVTVDSGYDDHIYRVLLCLDDYLESGKELLVEKNDMGLKELMQYVLKNTEDEKVIEKVNYIIDKYNLK